MSDEEYGEAPAPRMLATETWCENNAESVHQYVRMRVNGVQGIKAMRRVFGEEYYDSNISSRVHSLESTKYFIDEFNNQLAAIKVTEMWHEKLAVHKLLCIVNDELDKGSTRLKAIQELNVLVGITIVDENGKTRKGSKVGDFYESIGTEEKRGQSGQLGESNYGPTDEQLADYHNRTAQKPTEESTSAANPPETPYNGQPEYAGS